MTALEIRSSFISDAKGDEQAAFVLACVFIEATVGSASLGLLRAGDQRTMEPKQKRQVEPL